jgi:hypothetical protein
VFTAWYALSLYIRMHFVFKGLNFRHVSLLLSTMDLKCVASAHYTVSEWWVNSKSHL